MDELMNIGLIENLEVAEMNNENYRRMRTPHNPFRGLSEENFIKHFRLSKNLCVFLIETLEPFMRPKLRATDLDVETRVLIALNFYASGSYQTIIGCSKYLDVSQPSVCRAIKEVTEALNAPEIFNHWVHFPNNFEQLNNVRLNFSQKHGFPGVIGCIDCTHVAIICPPRNDPEHPEHLYINRKNYHSINVQLICDTNLEILNVNARFPGSTHDAYIWGRSNVQPFLRNLHATGHRNYFLLGDSGYPLRTWLLTPLEDDYAPGTPEYNCNMAHKSTRSKFECCNGVLKNRFRCLLKHRVLHVKPAQACKIINACVVLHNMCIKNNIPVPDDDDIRGVDFGMMGRNEDDIENEGNAYRRINPELGEGRRARRNLILHNF